MKQFIDKLIERLEEEKSFVPYNRILDTIEEKPKEVGQLMAYQRIIEIVNQLAEEHNSKHVTNDLAIVQSLPSLYPLQPFEEEAVHRVVEMAKSSNIQTIDVSELLGVSEQWNDGWIACSGCEDCQHKECEHHGKV